nr:unnamed protein product [Digitaria exilis]
MVAARRHLGSRVIITTRNEELVRDMVGAAAYREHHVQPMDDLDAWSLLKKQLPPQTDGEWCSLQELGSLSQLRDLKIQGLETVLPSSSAAAAKAKLHDKQQLRTLTLACNLPRQDETTSIGAMAQRVEEVLDQLCPPRHLGILCFENYLGRRGPSWLTAATVDLNSLMGGMGVGSHGDDRIAMPSLQRLFIHYCNNLERLPSGLASSKRVALKELRLDGAASITVLENFPSVEELCVFNCPSLKIIRGFVRLQLAVINCQALEVVEDVPTLDTLVLFDPAMETLPEYLRGLKARQLEVGCHRRLHDLFSLNIDISRLSDYYLAEREKVKHCGKVKVWPAASHAATIQGRQAAQNRYLRRPGSSFGIPSPSGAIFAYPSPFGIASAHAVSFRSCAPVVLPCVHFAVLPSLQWNNRGQVHRRAMRGKLHDVRGNLRRREGSCNGFLKEDTASL